MYLRFVIFRFGCSLFVHGAYVSYPYPDSVCVEAEEDLGGEGEDVGEEREGGERRECVLTFD